MEDIRHASSVMAANLCAADGCLSARGRGHAFCEVHGGLTLPPDHPLMVRVKSAEGRIGAARRCATCAEPYLWYPPKDASRGPCCLADPSTYRDKPLDDPQTWRAR